MGKNQNLRHQMRTAIFDAFQERVSRHSIHANDDRYGKITSYKTRGNLLDRVNNFCDWQKKQGYNFRVVNQVTQDAVVSYLDYKAVQGCTQQTLDDYRRDLKKIGQLCGCDWSVSRVYTNNRKSNMRGAASVISEKDYNILLDYVSGHATCGSAICLLLEKEIGVRVGDIAYGIRILPEKLEIRGKGGKVIYRSRTTEINRILELPIAKKMIAPDGTFLTPKANSLNKYLSRIEDKLDIERHSWHDIRRRIAQDRYDYLRNTGLSRSQAISACSVWLAHGSGSHRGRMLQDSYIANMW